ncbi:MAG: hypothetical protein AAGL49_15225, partial [Pseudomonadota bacterium]
RDIKADSVVLGLGAYARRKQLGDADFICRLTVDDKPYTIFYVDGRLVIRRGAEAPAGASIATDRNTLRRILTNEIAIDTAVGEERLTMSGAPDVLATLRRAVIRPANS